MNTLLLFLGLMVSPDADLMAQQQPAPKARPTAPQNRTVTAPADKAGKQQRLDPRNQTDSVHRRGFTKVDSVRRR